MFLKSALALPSIHITFLLSLALSPWQPFKMLQKGTAVLKRKGNDLKLSLFFFKVVLCLPSHFLARGGFAVCRAHSPRMCSCGVIKEAGAGPSGSGFFEWMVRCAGSAKRPCGWGRTVHKAEIEQQKPSGRLPACLQTSHLRKSLE